MIRIPFRIRLKLFLGLSLSLIVAMLMSCQDKAEKKTFSEVKGFDTPVQGQEIKMPADPHASAAPSSPSPALKLRWTLPEGWSSQEGTGMYTALLKTSGGEEALEGGVIALAGEAGGLQANIERWAGQLGLALSPAELKNFVNNQKVLHSKGNLEVTLVDFNSLVEGEGKSMLVGITKPGDDSYFIKITGPKANMVKAKSDFVKFCESLAVQ